MKEKKLVEIREVVKGVVPEILDEVVSRMSKERCMVSRETGEAFRTEEAGKDYLDLLKSKGRESDLKMNFEEACDKEIHKALQYQKDVSKKSIKEIKALKKRFKCERKKNTALRKELDHVEKRYKNLEEQLDKHSFLIRCLCSGGDYGRFISYTIDDLYKCGKQEVRKQRKNTNFISHSAPALSNYIEDKHGKH